MSKLPGTPSSQAYFNLTHSDPGHEVPVIDDEEPFFDVIKKLSEYDDFQDAFSTLD